DQQVERSNRDRLPAGPVDDVPRLAPEKGDAAVEIERAHDLVGVDRVELAVDRLDEPDVMPETAKPEHVLGDRPRRTGLPGIAANHPAKQDPQPHGAAPPPASRPLNTRSESRYSSASRRAVRQ